MKLQFPSFVVLFLVACACPVFGQNADSTDAFQKFDNDGDGKVTKEELPNEKAFERFDKDQDGVITRQEFAGAGKPGAGQPGGQFDALAKAADKTETARSPKRNRATRPGSQSSIKTRTTSLTPRNWKRSGRRLGANLGDGKAGGQVDDILKRLDKDGDGSLTKAEAGDAPWFDKLDKNSDGVLDAEELSKLAAARKKATK